MIARRNILLLLGYIGLGSIFRINTLSARNASNVSSLPPHIEALSLVWSTQQAQIKAIESKHAVKDNVMGREAVNTEGRWWFDVDARNWEVARPYPPGTLDSTHLFDVRYLIKGKELGWWRVETRKKEVTVIK